MAVVRASRFDRALFWLALAGVVMVLGGILVGAGVVLAVAQPAKDVWGNGWFRVGIAVMVLGAVMVWWAFTLYVAHRHAEGHMCPDPEAHRLPQGGAAATKGAGPEVLSVLRQLRGELKDAIPKMERSLTGEKFWPAGTEGDLAEKGWRKNRDQLRGMSGMNPLWDRLEDAFGHLKGINKLRANRVFKGYRRQLGDDARLRGAIASTETAITELEAKIANLDQGDSAGLKEPQVKEPMKIASGGKPTPAPPLVEGRSAGPDAFLAITNGDPQHVTLGAQAIELRGASFTGSMPWPMVWVDGGPHTRDLGRGETQLLHLGGARVAPDQVSGGETRHFFLRSPMGDVDIGTTQSFTIRVRVLFGDGASDYAVPVDFPYGPAQQLACRAQAVPWDQR